MELKITVDTDDMYEDMSFESLITDALKAEILMEAKTRFTQKEFAEFSEAVVNTIVADVKLRMSSFVAEDIALTDKWGKPTFIGSIEDLIKKYFDDVLLRPVDSYGKTLQGCTSHNITWIEWKIQDTLSSDLKCIMETASKNIRDSTRKYVDEKLIEIKERGIKKEIDKFFTSYLTK